MNIIESIKEEVKGIQTKKEELQSFSTDDRFLNREIKRYEPLFEKAEGNITFGTLEHMVGLEYTLSSLKAYNQLVLPKALQEKQDYEKWLASF